jgi:hypothetical protein
MSARRRGVAGVLVLVLGTMTGVSAIADDAGFQAQFSRRYASVAELDPDMLVEELRLRVELVASRGSQVGAASNERRVRGFESSLLRSLQVELCPQGRWRGPVASAPAAPVVDGVRSAADAQRLRASADDLAELSALAQRLVESQGERLCALNGLDDVE